ncbi:hypothetical protein FACS189435_3190 [Bacteroidia bacterium]|nr:hypothetical protein FACS189435_3190 [Bacteroidia bacterium]
MENKSRIDSILSDIKELEQLLEGVLNEKVYPVAFFSRSFDLAHHLLKDLHILEGEQIESLHKQMEEYRRLIESVSLAPETHELSLETNLIIPAPAAPEAAPNRPATLNDSIGRNHLSDLRKAFSLNDCFYFRKELFGGDEARMNKAIAGLNEMDSYEKSLAYVREQLKWDDSNATVAEFLTLVEKRFC